jgi:hypothetical protein
MLFLIRGDELPWGNLAESIKIDQWTSEIDSLGPVVD